MTPNPNEKFRGMTALELARFIEFAAVCGAVTLLKRVDVADNLGKPPELVLAEHMILAARKPEETL